MNDRIRVGILGATGYTAKVLIELLLKHPTVDIVALTSRREEPTPLSEIHPSLVGIADLVVENCSVSDVATKSDCLFSCLPHAASAKAIDGVDTDKTAIIDFSADYRLWDADSYEFWYGAHPNPASLSSDNVPYGLPELFRERIRDARIVANPGCYPTSAILAMAPLLAHNLVERDGIVFDSKSGVSGAGRKPSLTTLYPECNESIAAYKVGSHRHTPEIRQILGHVAGGDVKALFTPHLVPMDRGILTTGYAKLTDSKTTDELLAVLRAFYDNEPFIHVTENLPATKHVVGTNRCMVTAREVDGYATTISCIDNLVKGASGAAVQNMNLLFGLDETTALI